MGIIPPTAIGLVAASYLLGAIPFGLLIAKGFYQVDIRHRGSGNPGATNVWRTLGAKPGLATLLLDIVKGALPVIAARSLFGDDLPVNLASGLAAIIGHNWSVFLRGSGGKGVATSAGVFLALIPEQASYALLAFAVFFLTTRHVSVGSMAGAFTLMVTTFFIDTPATLRVVILIASLMIMIKHVPNMRRLARGEEPRVKFR